MAGLTTTDDQLSFKSLNHVPVDFESMVEVLVQRIKERLPNTWTDFLESNSGMELLEVCAYEGTLLAYLINTNASEMFLPTAKTKEGIYKLVKLIGYNPLPPSSARVQVRFYLDTAYNKNIIIPKYTRLSTGSVPFYTTEDAVLYSGSTSLLVDCVAGTLRSDTFIATGVANATYTLSNYPVSFVESVFVNDEAYTEVDFIDTQGGNKYFQTTYTNDFKCKIIFGDGIYGINPSKQSIIEVYYNTGGGEDTNVSAYSITNIIDQIRDVDNTVVSTLKCVNDNNASGGDDEESVEEVRVNAPSIYRTQYRAVTKQDFKDIVAAEPGIAKAAVLDNTDDSNIGIYGVKVAIIPDGGGRPTEELSEYIEDLLDNKKVIATSVDVINPSIIPIDVSVSIKTNSAYNTNTVLNNVRSTIQDYLSWSNNDFGDDVAASNLYSLINDVNGVVYADNLVLSENKSIYLNATPVAGTTSLTVIDTMNILNANTEVVVLDKNGEMAYTIELESIDGNSVVTKTAIPEDADVIDECRIYPIMTLNSDLYYGDKYVEVENTNLVELSNTIIFFGDNTSLEYHVTFRSGNSFYIQEEINRHISAGTKIYVKCKNPQPRIYGDHDMNSSSITLETTPKFGVGTVVYPNKKIEYNTEITIMTKGSDNFDIINESDIYGINSVYVAQNTPFVEGSDYIINDNDKVVWLKNVIETGETYYVEIIKTSIASGAGDTRYYVTRIEENVIYITPSLLFELEDGDLLNTESTSINMLNYEISHYGTITIQLLD